jgi:hypothetical protein
LRGISKASESSRNGGRGIEGRFRGRVSPSIVDLPHDRIKAKNKWTEPTQTYFYTLLKATHL